MLFRVWPPGQLLLGLASGAAGVLQALAIA